MKTNEPPTEFPLDNPIPAHQIPLRSTLPVKPVCIPINGYFINLEPYNSSEHLHTLYNSVNGNNYLYHKEYNPELLVWRYLWGFPSTINEFETRINKIVTNNDSCLWVVRLTSMSENLIASVCPKNNTNENISTINTNTKGTIVGTMAYIANRPDNLCLEIAYVLFTPTVQGTPIATECTYLLLNHAFQLGYRRIEWKTNVLNIRSRNAALRLGFTFEGIFRHHMIVQNNCNRDTAWYSMLDSEFFSNSETKTENDNTLIISPVDTTNTNSASSAISIQKKLEQWIYSEQALELFRKRLVLLTE